MISKEEAIKNHRVMWNWIADQYEKGNDGNIHFLKKKYLLKTLDSNPELMESITLHACCYCCYYAGVNGLANNNYRFNCDQCPVVWPSYAEEGMCCEGPLDMIGVYKFIDELTVSRTNVDRLRDIIVKLCRFVAGLPENTYSGSMESIGKLAEERDRLIDMYHNLCEEARER